MKRFNFSNGYSIVAETWEKSRSWGHKATLISPNGKSLAHYTIRYYNRTWESYEYQSVMENLICDEITEERSFIAQQYKEEHNIKRLSQAQRDKLEDNDYIKDLLIIKGEL